MEKGSRKRAIGSLTAYLFSALLLATLVGCIKDRDPEPDVRPVDPNPKVFLMYDNIGGWFAGDVAEAAEAVAEGALAKQNQRVIVFQRSASGSSIFELVRDKKAAGGYSRKIVKEYPVGENNDLSVETIRNVVSAVRAYAPAPHYGLAFGSHGLGWIPKSIWGTVPISRRAAGAQPSGEHPFAELLTPRENPTTRFFRSSWNENLDVSEFIDALDEWEWDFILLDDCFMAGVEALYEMRDLADYIIASPTEIMAAGFPYDRVVSRLFADWDDIEVALTDVSRGFVDWYTEGNGGRPCATVSVVKTSELDALAAAIARLDLTVNELASVEGIQYYEGYTRPGHVFYDLDDYLGRVRTGTDFDAFRAQLERAVVFAGHTDTFYSDFGARTQHPITHFSGLAVFIPWSATTSLVPSYQQTEWYKAVYRQ